MNDGADRERVYFRQLLSGRDFAVGDPIATQMVNFAYAIGDRDSRQCVLVDPAYAVDDLVDIVEADGMDVVGVLATHYHPDHVGGSMMGHDIDGVARLLERVQCPIHVQADEAPWVQRTAGVGEADLVAHEPGDVVTVGGVDITLVHTPGHTPGSQCFLVDGRLVAGDTLFLEGCGRTDLPGADASAMFDSLRTLAELPATTVLFPGHRYSLASSATMDAVTSQNYVFKPETKAQWLSMFAGHDVRG
ncbi:MAG: MBL fold metallo-hydrolase [Actinomycetota bacterium]|nr:MBL fold metallo-hydrolase [Actinomycetota bacterium]